MSENFTDKLEDARRRLNDIQSTATALSEALAFSGYDAEAFTGAANLISDDIEGVANELNELVNEIIHA